MCWDTLQAFSQPWSCAGCRDRALCQQTLQPCCLERTVLPRYCCWIYAVRYLGGLNCPLACQECPLSTSQLWMGNLSFLPVLCGWCALLLILPLYPNPLLQFVIQYHKAQSSGFRQSKKEERSVIYFQAVRNRAVALGTPGGLWVGAAMGGQWWEQTDRQTLGTASIIAGLPLGERIAAAIPTGANLLLLLLSPMFIRLQLQTSFVQEVIWTFLASPSPLLPTEKGTMHVCLSGQGELLCSIGNLAWEEENLRYQNQWST